MSAWSPSARRTAGLLGATGATGAVFVSTAFLFGAVGSDARPAAAKANIVTVVAFDYAFQAPDTIPAGTTTFRLINKGPDLHHLYIVKLEAGKTLGDYAAAMQAPNAKPPAWAIDVGGPNTPMPGRESNATLALDAGRYVLICVIPAMKDGQPHFMKGMLKELLVAPAGDVRAPQQAGEPRPDITLTLSDYDFALSAPITAGTRTIRVRNAAAQSHEVSIAKLNPGVTAKQLLAAIGKPQGPPPGVILGGVTGMAKGRHNDFTLTFDKGDYALICFWPDSKDGKPHFVHGMIKQIRVE
jgi:uncharacterized cupredoxin-like copper-binding protein